jgi:hypothetical protein
MVKNRFPAIPTVAAFLPSLIRCLSSILPSLIRCLSSILPPPSFFRTKISLSIDYL